MMRTAWALKNSLAWVRFARCACCLLGIALGCRSAVPIYVWQPAPFTCPRDARIAIAPVAGETDVAARVENAFMKQRPMVRSDLQLISSQQLFERSPIRLVSTAALENDATAIQAAKQTAANLLLEGQVLSVKFVDAAERVPSTADTAPPNEQLLISWRVIDLSTSKTVGNHVVSMDTHRADRDYPDLLLTQPDPTQRLIVASVRDSWKGLAPCVTKDEVELMVPWLQIGALKVRQGIVDAHQGHWDLAAQKFEIATRRNPFNIAAHHNLAIAQAAGEDFAGAKTRLSDVSWPLSLRLPAESRFWLDQRHRQFQAAHGLEKPAEGWLFPEPGEPLAVVAARPTSIEELPWWTAIPLTKPPGWTWRAWLNQPWIL